MDYWRKKAENAYSADTGGVYPKYVDENGVEREEMSPYFETISKTVLKRGFLRKREFVSISKWKTETLLGILSAADK